MNTTRIPVLVALSLFFFGLNLSTVHAAISIGKTVRCTENGVNVRSSPGTSSSILGTQNSGAQGVVLDGPQSASGYTWWKVNFSSGADGWMASIYLSEVNAAVVATPVINPGSMSATSPLSITMSTSTSGATIRYTTNGSDPTSTSTIYSGAFTLSSSATVKARAFKSGMTQSAVASRSYTISAPTVTALSNNVPVSNLSGAQGSERTYRITVPSGQAKLEIKTYGGSGDADLYVKRGSVPTTSSYDFAGTNGGNTETITINSPASGDWFIKVRAYSAYSGLTLVASYTGGTSVVATPVINPGSMSATSPLSITMSTSTSGATIRYTTNGSDPTTSSTIYGGAFTLSSSATVKARAFKTGMTQSAVASASYTISASSVTTLSNNSPVTGLSGSAGAAHTYKITVPSGQAKLEIKIYGGSGDADLYVKRGSVPTTSSFDYRPYLGGNTETITVDNPASGDWFVMIRGFSQYSGLTLVAAHYANFTVALDAVSPTVLRVGTSVTIRGTLRRNGVALPNYQFGVHNGLRQQSHMATTDSTGRFAITSTPIVAQASVVEFLTEGRSFASAAYQVLPSTTSPASLLAREIQYKNNTTRTIKALVTNPYGQTLNYTIPPNSTQKLVSSNARGFTFKPTTYAGTFATAGVGAGDIGGSITVDTSGVATVQVTGGAAVLLRFSTYTTSQLDAGVCWSPGGSIGAGGGVQIGADICIGSNGLSVGGGGGLGFITSGFSIQLIEW